MLYPVELRAQRYVFIAFSRRRLAFFAALLAIAHAGIAETAYQARGEISKKMT
jgi:hypothetical protein